MKTLKAGLLLLLCTTLPLMPSSGHAATVANCDEASLRANLVRGGAIRIACGGVIGLSNTLVISADTEIDASGYPAATLSGRNAVRVFEVLPGVSLTLRNVIITRGQSTNGAGIYNAGTLTLDHCVLTGNRAVGATGLQGADGASAPPHPPADPQDGQPGGNGGSGGPATGGAIYNAGTCLAWWTTVSSNSAAGGLGGGGGRAGGPNYAPGNLTSGGFGGNGGSGAGGAIFNSGELTLSNCSVFANRATGGRGGAGGNNYPAFSTGPRGPGGAAFGAGVRSVSKLTLVNVTLASNEAIGGDSGGTFGFGGGDGVGGGISAMSDAGLTNCTLAWNRAAGGSGPTPGAARGGNLATTGAVAVLKNVILAHAPGGTNAYGPLLDAGHNLSSDASAGFSAPTSVSSINPGLGTLTDAGGPTLSIPLLGSSPAIDAGDASACPATDQRGRPRPALVGCDIGAFEVQPEFWLFSFKSTGLQTFRLRGIGLPGAGFRLQTSDDCLHWTPLGGPNTAGADGLITIDVTAGNPPTQFFRTVSP